MSATGLDEEDVSTIRSRDVLVANEAGAGAGVGGAEQSLSPVGALTTSPPSAGPRPSSLDDGVDEVIEESTHSFEGVREGPSSCQEDRLKVGFLSAYFFHHSVGLLTKGVITRLDRHRFETTAIFLQPHPRSAVEEEPARGRGDAGGDDVYTAVRRGTENVLDVPASR